jgi:hypothetical protein
MKSERSRSEAQYKINSEMMQNGELEASDLDSGVLDSDIDRDTKNTG